MNIQKIFITMLITFIGNLMFSQSKNKLSIETQGGYEYNYFRSPLEIRTDTDILSEDDLIDSSFYQDATLNYKYQYKSKRHNLSIYATPAARIFYETLDDSYWSLYARANYSYKFNKRTGMFIKGKWKRMNREGLGGDQDVLINPLGYTTYGGSVGFDFQLFKNHQVTVEGLYNFRDFDAFGVRDLQYDEYGIQLSNVQTFKVRRLKHKIGINAYAKKRLYDTFNASELDTDGERDWDYIKGTLFYKLPFSKQFELKPSFVYYVRIDNSTRRSGFNQFGPGMSVNFDNNKTKIKGTFSYITRSYTDIEARNTDGPIGEKLKYEYSNVQIKGSQNIGKGFSITATVFSKIRSTNYTDIDARSFRNYRNQYAGIGVLWGF